MIRLFVASMLLLFLIRLAAAIPPPCRVEGLRHLPVQISWRERGLDADSSHSYDMLGLSLDYRVEVAAVPMTGNAYLTVRGVAVLDTIVLDAEGLTVMSVRENGADLPFVQVGNLLRVARHLVPGDTMTLEMAVSVPPIGSLWDLGYHVAQNHVFTFSQPFGARRWIPCFDQPFDKLNELTVAVNMPDSWSLASNGELVETTFPELGRKREVYRHTAPITTYLISICAGRYARWFEEVNGVQYRYFAFPEDSANAAYDWQRTPLMTEVYARLFGPYPFGEYGMAQALIMGGWGAMEHQTFTTYGTNLVDGRRTFEWVVAHELAHMWFGDDITCVDFRHIWLNEGFATYSEALFYEQLGGETALQQMLQRYATSYFYEDSRVRYPMYDPPPGYMFGAVVYNKGAWVLHMLRRQLLGDSLFFVLLRNYRAAHRGGNVDTEDLVAAVYATYGDSLRWFFQQWVYQAGHPELWIDVAPATPEPDRVTVSVQQMQTNAPVFRFPLLLEVATEQGEEHRQFWFDQAQQSVVETFSAPVLSAVLLPHQPLLYVPVDTIAARERALLPADFSLGPVFPNPFNAEARVPFELAREMSVRISLYDLLGRHVQTLAKGRWSAGRHEIGFHASGALASGVYLVSLEADGASKWAKVVLLR